MVKMKETRAERRERMDREQSAWKIPPWLDHPEGYSREALRDPNRYTENPMAAAYWERVRRWRKEMAKTGISMAEIVARDGLA